MKRIASFILALPLLLISCKKEDPEPAAGTSHKIVVTDNAGQTQANAEIKLYHSLSDLKSSTNAYLTLQTDSNGSVVLPENQVLDSLICKATKGSLTSEFTAFKYAPSNRTYSVVVKQPAQSQLLCGHGSKNWLMTGYKINGNPQSYVVTSTLKSDGTWTDTNGNSGTWHFASSTELVYDYTSSGMTVSFTVVELTAGFISLTSVQSGMTIDMEMKAVY